MTLGTFAAVRLFRLTVSQSTRFDSVFTFPVESDEPPSRFRYSVPYTVRNNPDQLWRRRSAARRLTRKYESLSCHAWRGSRDQTRQAATIAGRPRVATVSAGPRLSFGFGMYAFLMACRSRDSVPSTGARSPDYRSEQ